MNRRSFQVTLAMTGLCATLSAAPPDYHLFKKVDVGGKGAWDYMIYDPAGHRVFVSRTFHVMVLDGETGATIGDIAGTDGVHGIALAPEFGKGFTSNGHSDTVTIFDLQTLKATGETPTGKRPDAIIYDPASKRVFTFNSESHDATAIDAASGQTVGTVPLPGRPEFAVADGQGGVFVNIEDKNSLGAIDAKALTFKAAWEMPGCDGPSGLSMDREHRRVFSVCGNKTMAVMDPDAGKLVATVPIGDGPDASTFSPKLAMAFSPNGQDGTLTVVHEDSPDKFAVAGTVKTESGARTMALDEDTGTVYLVTSTVGPTLILGFILEIFRSYLRPGEGVLGGMLLIIGLWLLMHALERPVRQKRVWWGLVLLAVGAGLAYLAWQYDAVQLALSPADFHMTIWR